MASPSVDDQRLLMSECSGLDLDMGQGGSEMNISNVGNECLRHVIEEDDVVASKSLSYLYDFSTHFGPVFDIDISNEKNKFSENIDRMLAEMEEFCKLVDKAFIDVVKSDVSSLERVVRKAETDLSTGSLMKRFSCLVSMKGEGGSNKSYPTHTGSFTPPEVFRTEQYLTSMDTTDYLPPNNTAHIDYKALPV